MNRQNTKGKLHRSLQTMIILPLLVLGLVISIFSYQAVKSTMHTEVNTELQNIADLLHLADENLYKGKENGRNQVVI